MKTIKLLQITLQNFKGTRQQTIKFEDTTNIFGANRSGKTTIFDAFTWLLFGKDSTDRSDFEIKTLDKFNNAIPKLEHKVSAIVEVDGVKIEIERVYREKWVTRRGASEPVFDGHETTYFWNQAPLRKKEYDERIAEICDEFIFKLITSPTAFSSLKWQDRRDTLMSIAGDISFEELAQGNSQYEILVEKLNKHRGAEEYKSMLQASVRKAKQEIKLIPARIDEVYRTKVEDQDYDKIRKEIEDLTKKISETEEKMQDSTKAFESVLTEINTKREQIHHLEQKASDIKRELSREAKEATKVDDRKLQDLKGLRDTQLRARNHKVDELNLFTKQIDSLSESILKREEAISKKREEWREENAKQITFDEHIEACPTCKRAFEAEDVEERKEEMIANFNAEKSSILNSINEEGKKLTEEKGTYVQMFESYKRRWHNMKDEVKNIDEHIGSLDAQIKTEEEAISTPEESEDDVYIRLLDENKELKLIASQVTEIKSTIPEAPKVDNEELRLKREEYLSEIRAFNDALRHEKTNQIADDRIKYLQEEESKLAQQIMNVDKEIFLLEEFNRTRIEEIESRVRRKFKMVSFKMFEQQINGGERETCITLIDGVPYEDANTASKINAGIDIINALSKFYKVQAPIFVDNRESVSELIETESQLVNLIVSPEDKEIRVE